jgi:hypothetical protein
VGVGVDRSEPLRRAGRVGTGESGPSANGSGDSDREPDGEAGIEGLLDPEPVAGLPGAGRAPSALSARARRMSKPRSARKTRASGEKKLRTVPICGKKRKREREMLQ